MASSSKARKTPSGRWFPFDLAMAAIRLVASVILPRTRNQRGDSEMKGRTRKMKRKEGREEAM